MSVSIGKCHSRIKQIRFTVQKNSFLKFLTPLHARFYANFHGRAATLRQQTPRWFNAPSLHDRTDARKKRSVHPEILPHVCPPGIDVRFDDVKQAFMSRSRVEAFNLCPRRGYFEYMFAGVGLSVDPGAVYFDTGNAIHSGLAECLRFVQKGIMKPETSHIIACIAATIADFDKRSGTINIERLMPQIAKLEMDYRSEQRDLAAGVVYAWIVEEWEAFAARFEVIAVELDTHFTNSAANVVIHWESKADAIIRERIAPHQVAVISWKSAANTNEWTRRRYRSDLQGFLECWFAERHTGIPIDYNQVIFLVKGKKLRLGENGIELPWNCDISEIRRYATDTFLLAPYVKPDNVAAPFFNELRDVVANTIWSPSYRRPGNLTDSYFRGWNRPEHFRLNDLDPEGWPNLFSWIDSLKANQIFPTYEFQGGQPPPLNRLIVWEDRSPRNHRLTEQLLKEISFMTARYARASGPDQSDTSADVVFGRNLRSCYDGPPDALGRTGCPFVDLCKGPAQVIPRTEQFDPRIDPPPNGFIWRKPHHVREAEAFASVKTVDFDAEVPF